MTGIWLALAVVLAGALYIRLAPSDAARWHQRPDLSESRDVPGGAMRRVVAGPEALERITAIALAEPRTTLLAGSPQEGMVTLVSRSMLFGFPDYTTIARDGDTLLIHARLRFGRSDFGVNAARVDRWISALTAGQ